ncbi:MAG: hypothetical protein AMJ61_16670, partial [Desulfobacterales bacterium SG8_35_2]
GRGAAASLYSPDPGSTEVLPGDSPGSGIPECPAHGSSGRRDLGTSSWAVHGSGLEADLRPGAGS